jgi:acyl dehydratase
MITGIAVGDVVPGQQFDISRADLVRYAGASGDFNPIHWDEATATSIGLPGVIAHGMLTMALACRVVTDWVGDPGAVLDYSVKFTRPVVVPADGVATLEVTAVVKTIDEFDRAVVDLRVSAAGQSVLIKAQALVQLSATEAGAAQ